MTDPTPSPVSPVAEDTRLPEFEAFAAPAGYDNEQSYAWAAGTEHMRNLALPLLAEFLAEIDRAHTERDKLGREVDLLHAELARSAPAIPQDAERRIADKLRGFGLVDPDDDTMPVFKDVDDEDYRIGAIDHWVGAEGIAEELIKAVRSWLSAPAADPAPATCPECLCAGGIHKTWCKGNGAAPARSCSCGGSCACYCVCDEGPAPATGDARVQWGVRIDGGSVKFCDSEQDARDWMRWTAARATESTFEVVSRTETPWRPFGQAPAQPTATPSGPGEFFEEDEPVAEVLAAFRQGPHFVTAPSTSAAPARLADLAGPAAREDAATPDVHDIDVNIQDDGWATADCRTCGASIGESVEDTVEDWVDRHRADTLRPSGPVVLLCGQCQTAPAEPPREINGQAVCAGCWDSSVTTDTEEE